MKKYNRGDVVKIVGTMYGDANTTNAQAININAEILKQVLDRLDILEVGIEARRDQKSS
jgi:hypothetical protein